MKNMTGMMIRHENLLQILEFPLFKPHKEILNFSSTRFGGVSKGEYESLNLGEYCGDDDIAVSENRKRLCQALSVSTLFAPNQVHESRILEIDDDFLSLHSEKQTELLTGVDALITNRPNVCIAVTTADCVPILLYAPDKKVIATVHAGWRGTVLQIVPKAVQRMKEHYNCDPKEIIAGIGPSICQANYEVGQEIVNAFRMIGSNLEVIAKANHKTGKPHIDLWEANRQQLLQSGLLPENIDLAGLCTYSNPADFFSARRQGMQCGRMLSGIMIK